MNAVWRGALAVGIGWAAVGCAGDEGVEKPAALSAESTVEYPVEMWNQGVEGRALLRVLLNEEGGVDSVMIAESSGHAALDSAAIAGVRAMAFDPAREDGEPRQAWAEVPVRFSKDLEQSRADSASGSPPGPRGGA